jgi:hypothetical protein
LNQPGHQCHQEKRQKDKKQDFGDPGCGGSDPGKTEQGGYQGNNEKDQSPSQQCMFLSRLSSDTNQVYLLISLSLILDP